ncbi:hypothetical protein M9458_013058, partial [Cirrhinus mrigala]
VHDAKVLRQSYLWKMLNDGQPLNQNKVNISGCDVGYYLIGDSAYPMQNWLMKPFPDTGRLTPQQRMFNLRMSSARNDCKLELIKKMVLTCCVLHNICEERGDNFSEDLSSIHVNMQPPVQALTEHGKPEGTDIRAALLDHFERQNSEIIQVAEIE